MGFKSNSLTEGVETQVLFYRVRFLGVPTVAKTSATSDQLLNASATSLVAVLNVLVLVGGKSVLDTRNLNSSLEKITLLV